MSALLNKISDSYLFIIVVALTLGVVFPDYSIYFAPYTTILLGIIFFLSALKIDLKAVFKQFEKPWTLIVVNALMLLLIPIIVYYITLWLYPNLAIPFLLLAAMPAGMTAPLLTEISGGKKSLALILTVLTSLLAPFTIPLVIKFLAGTSVEVSVFDMMISLAEIIFIPFILAHLIKRHVQTYVDRVKGWFSPISIILLAFLIMGIVSNQAETILDSFLSGNYITHTLIALFVFFVTLHVIGYFAVPWRHSRDRIAITVCLTYMNFTLAIYLADTFFIDQTVVVPVILSILPWTLLLPLFKRIAPKLPGI